MPRVLEEFVDADLAEALAAYQVELESVARFDPDPLLLDENGKVLLDEMGSPISAPRRHTRRAMD